MTRSLSVEAKISNLKLLSGVWAGNGSGQFPTIDPFRYREILRITTNEMEPGIAFEQTTWKLFDDGSAEEPLHWESGFFLVRDDGKIDLLNAQNSGRVEVLSGEMSVAKSSPNAFTLNLRSVILAHDPQMRQSRRIFTFQENQLTYSVDMATDKVADIQSHLNCQLTRNKDRR